MNQKESLLIINEIRNNYLSMKIDDPVQMAKTWARRLQRHDYQDVRKAVEVYLDSDNAEYPPSVHKIKKILESNFEDVINPYDAFDLLQDALTNGDLFDNWQSLPDSIKRVIKSPADLRKLATMKEEVFITSYKNSFIREYQDKNKRKTAVGDFKSVEVTEDMIDRDEFKKAEIRVKNGTYLTDRDWEYMNFYGGFKQYKECKGRPIRLEEE